jgi:hypothetical protein
MFVDIDIFIIVYIDPQHIEILCDFFLRRFITGVHDMSNAEIHKQVHVSGMDYITMEEKVVNHY